MPKFLVKKLYQYTVHVEVEDALDQDDAEQKAYSMEGEIQHDDSLVSCDVEELN